MRKILVVISILLLAFGGVMLDSSNFSQQEVQDRYVEQPIATVAPPVKEEIVYEMKTYDDLLAKHGVSKDNITEKDLIGSGTQSDPYIILSTKGFLFLLDEEESGIPDSKCKYVELGSDIVLNDETFNENGNPMGGDGVYYPMHYGARTIVSFDGKGHIIKGLYMDSVNAGWGGDGSAVLFEKIDYLKNTIVENIYMNAATSAVVFAFNVPNGVDNCKVINGTMRATKFAYPITQRVMKGEISNCETNVKIFSGNSAGGICIETIKITNCISHCDIEVAGDVQFAVCGIGAASQGIEGCINYGNITAPKAPNIAGIGTAPYYKDCKNYGNITGRSYVAGIIHMVRADTTLLNCENYGNIAFTAVSCGALVGCLFGGPFKFQAINCISDNSKTDVPMIGSDYGSGEKYVTIKNCTFNINNTSNASGFIIGSCSSVVDLKIIDTEINIKSTIKCSLIGWFSAGMTKNVFIKNVIVRGDTSLIEGREVYYFAHQVKSHVSSLIFDLNNEKYYYGSDFSNYYIAFKTGKIGLITRDGRGTFQAQVDEQVLEAKGFTKKLI